jgi:hypothetical protein
MSSLGHQAIAIKIRILLVVASFRAGSAGNSKEELGRLLLAIKNGKSPSMEPLISLAMAETASSSVEVDSVLERLWASQRYLDIVDWLPGVAAELERATAIKWKQRIVSVIQRAAGSIDDAGIRTEFLRRGSTSRALKFAMG